MFLKRHRVKTILVLTLLLSLFSSNLLFAHDLIYLNTSGDIIRHPARWHKKVYISSISDYQAQVSVKNGTYNYSSAVTNAVNNWTNYSNNRVLASSVSALPIISGTPSGVVVLDGIWHERWGIDTPAIAILMDTNGIYCEKKDNLRNFGSFIKYAEININHNFLLQNDYSSTEKDKTIAHEFGHSLGLDDMYTAHEFGVAGAPGFEDMITFDSAGNPIPSIMWQGRGSSLSWTNYQRPTNHDRSDLERKF